MPNGPRNRGFSVAAAVADGGGGPNTGSDSEIDLLPSVETVVLSFSLSLSEADVHETGMYGTTFWVGGRGTSNTMRSSASEGAVGIWNAASRGGSSFRCGRSTSLRSAAPLAGPDL